MGNRGNQGLTMMEIIIVIAIIAILAVIAIYLINPKNQFDKANDARRKSDLAALQKALEDWYNDKGCYPKPPEICYNGVPESAIRICRVGNLISHACNICGNEPASPPFSPYLSKLPCDPEHSRVRYIYEVEPLAGHLCSDGGDLTNPCPQWYHLYANLSYESDPASSMVGCPGHGCGTFPLFGNNYGISSPNTALSRTTTYYFMNTTNECNSCGSRYIDCVGMLNKKSPNSIYGSLQNCINNGGH